jgi:HEAT repeat protein
LESPVINRLVIMLDDTDDDVRCAACYALGGLGEKAVSNDVIARLMDMLKDKNKDMRLAACVALGKMGGKVATHEVIDKLLFALRDINYEVRRTACNALGRLGKETISKDVIDGLVVAARDRDYDVSSSACQSLGELCGKNGTDDIIRVLLDNCGADITIGKILASSPCLSYLKDDTVKKLLELNKTLALEHWDRIATEKFIAAFLDTGISSWLPIIKTVFICRRYGLTVSKNTVAVYGSRESTEILFSNRKFGKQLQNYFLNWIDDYCARVDTSSSLSRREESYKHKLSDCLIA